MIVLLLMPVIGGSSPSTSQSHAENRVERCVNLKPLYHTYTAFVFLFIAVRSRAKVLGQLLFAPLCLAYTHIHLIEHGNVSSSSTGATEADVSFVVVTRHNI